MKFRGRVTQEVTLLEGIHTQYSTGYIILATKAESCHGGGIAIIWLEEEVWHIKGATNYGPNGVSFAIKVVWKRWYVFGE